MKQEPTDAKTMSKAEGIIKLRALLDPQQVGMFTTSAANGELHSRPLTLLELDDEGTFWFFVSISAEWVTGLSFTTQVNLTFSHEESQTWTSIAGTAALHQDRARIDRLWTADAGKFFPQGVDDPSLRLLGVFGRTAEYWDVPTGRIERLALAAKGLIGGESTLGETGSVDLS